MYSYQHFYEQNLNLDIDSARRILMSVNLSFDTDDKTKIDFNASSVSIEYVDDKVLLVEIFVVCIGLILIQIITKKKD